VAVFVTLLGYWQSDQTLPFFRFTVLGLLCLPFRWLIRIVRTIAGIVLASGIGRSARIFAHDFNAPSYPWAECRSAAGHPHKAFRCARRTSVGRRSVAR
jgi:hypothetical protein